MNVDLDLYWEQAHKEAEEQIENGKIVIKLLDFEYQYLLTLLRKSHDPESWFFAGFIERQVEESSAD